MAAKVNEPLKRAISQEEKVQLEGVKYWLDLLKILLHFSKNSASILDVCVQAFDVAADGIVILDPDGLQGPKAFAALGGYIQ